MNSTLRMGIAGTLGTLIALGQAIEAGETQANPVGPQIPAAAAPSLPVEIGVEGTTIVPPPPQPVRPSEETATEPMDDIWTPAEITEFERQIRAELREALEREIPGSEPESPTNEEPQRTMTDIEHETVDEIAARAERSFHETMIGIPESLRAVLEPYRAPPTDAELGWLKTLTREHDRRYRTIELIGLATAGAFGGWALTATLGWIGNRRRQRNTAPAAEDGKAAKRWATPPPLTHSPARNETPRMTETLRNAAERAKTQQRIQAKQSERKLAQEDPRERSKVPGARDTYLNRPVRQRDYDPNWPPTNGQPFEARAYVTDGDDIKAFGIGVTTNPCLIRLHGIDAPEKTQPGGRAAMTQLRTLINKKTVTVIPEGWTDDGRRMLATIRHGPKSTNINRRMVRDGHAWNYDRDHPRYPAQERRARAAGRGLWNAPADQPPIHPRDWKRNLGAQDTAKVRENAIDVLSGPPNKIMARFTDAMEDHDRAELRVPLGQGHQGTIEILRVRRCSNERKDQGTWVRVRTNDEARNHPAAEEIRTILHRHGAKSLCPVWGRQGYRVGHGPESRDGRRRWQSIMRQLQSVVKSGGRGIGRPMR